MKKLFKNKKILFYLIAVIVFVVTVGGTFLLIESCDNPNKSKAHVENNQLYVAPLYPVETIKLSSMSGASLKSFSLTAFSEGEETPATMSKTIQATVLPVDAPDKTVLWSISWENEEETANVSDYVTIETSGTDNCICTVVAHQPFSDKNLILTATTKVGGFKAFCNVQYRGLPETLDIIENGGVYNGDVYELNAGTTYEFDIVADNGLNSVAEDLSYSVEIHGFGNLNLSKRNTATDETEIISAEVSGIIGTGRGVVRQAGINSTPTVDLFRASIVENKLRIEVLSTCEAYHEIKRGVLGFGSEYEYAFDSYPTEDIPYFTITVKVNLGLFSSSSVNTTIKIRTSSLVEEINVDNGNLVF